LLVADIRCLELENHLKRFRPGTHGGNYDLEPGKSDWFYQFQKGSTTLPREPHLAQATFP
jgi:hypothetical protein